MNKPPRLQRRHVLGGMAAFGATIIGSRRSVAAPAPSELRIDYATYNPISLLIKDKGWLESELQAEGIRIRWVRTLGSNKALEFLNAGSIDFGSTAGAAALIGRINGNPVKSIYRYSRPEWTALVGRAGGEIGGVAELKGRRVAVTRGTDPHIFLIRALAAVGLTEKDVKPVPLQHGDGKAALIRGDVDAWAGLDPIMAAAEINEGARLFYRNPAFNSGGILNVSEAFATAHRDIVRRVLAVYEKGRIYALAHPDVLTRSLVAAAKLPDAVIQRQLARTDLSSSAIDAAQRQTVLVAGKALQAAGVVKPDVDIAAAVDALIDTSFLSSSSSIR